MSETIKNITRDYSKPIMLNLPVLCLLSPLYLFDGKGGFAFFP